MNKKIVLTAEEAEKITKEYAEGLDLKSQIYVELEGTKEVDTLVLLRVMDNKLDFDLFASVMETFLDGASIVFRINDTEEGVVFRCVYNKGSGNRLHLMFTEKPYLYDVLQKAVYVLMLKKLTPHLEGSN